MSIPNKTGDAPQMNEKDKRLIISMLNIIGQYQQLLGDALPVFHAVETTLRTGRTPTAEERQTWEQGSRVFEQRLFQLNGAVQSLHQVVDPLLGFDA